jgi:histidine ammonia-lyase
LNTTLAVFTIGDHDLTLNLFREICRGNVRVELGATALQKIKVCDEFRRSLAVSEKRMYGINTGFGKLADTVIPLPQQAQLQKNLIRSHAVGWGEPLSREEARGLILLRAMSLSHGYSGARPEVVQQLIWLLESGLHPWIPSRGSVGASGDLAPLSHLALVLMGEGDVLDEKGCRTSAAEALATQGREPLELEAKEGLALINGTQLMNSLGLLGAARALDMVRYAALAGVMSLEALEGSALPFGEKYHSLRPHPEINDVAASFRALLAGSSILAGHTECSRVQDPYSVRCSPQVIGASLGVVRHASDVFLRESRAVTDNPVLLPEEKQVVTGGHFHGQPLAFQLDFLYQSTSELANIAERRVNLMLSGNGGRLPRFLASDPGLESGLMIAQYLAAGLVSENKSKAFPAAVDSVPTSDGQEDHVSMGSVGALKLQGVLDRTEAVIALELLTAGRALQFITREELASRTGRQPLQLSRPLQELLDDLGTQIDLSPGDRPLTDDVQTVINWMRADNLSPNLQQCLAAISGTGE